MVDLNQYAKHMNDRLFGFPDESGLKLYTDVLVRLKSPKLTKGGGPDDLKDTLNHSLPSLTEQELSALTTTVQAQDQTQREIVKTQADLSFAVKLDKGYDDYVSYVFADKAKHFLDYMQELQNVNAEYDATLAEIADKTEAYNATELQIQAIKSEIEGLKEARSELKHEEVSNLEDALNSAKNTFQKLEGDKIDKSSRFDNKKNKHYHSNRMSAAELKTTFGKLKKK